MFLLAYFLVGVPGSDEPSGKVSYILETAAGCLNSPQEEAATSMAGVALT